MTRNFYPVIILCIENTSKSKKKCKYGTIFFREDLTIENSWGFSSGTNYHTSKISILLSHQIKNVFP
jgi:hypothetical protein